MDVRALAIVGGILQTRLKDRDTLGGGGLGAHQHRCRGQLHLARVGRCALDPEAREDRPSQRVVAAFQMLVLAQPVEQRLGAPQVAGLDPVQHFQGDGIGSVNRVQQLVLSVFFHDEER